MKNILLLILLLTYTSQLKAQYYGLPPKPNYDLPPKPNYGLPTIPTSGKCYYRSTKENTEPEWREVDCKFIKLKKEELISLQHKLKNLNYDVDITGCFDEKTYIAYITEKKEKKIRERKERKKLRKAKKRKNKSEQHTDPS